MKKKVVRGIKRQSTYIYSCTNVGSFVLSHAQLQMKYMELLVIKCIYIKKSCQHVNGKPD